MSVRVLARATDLRRSFALQALGRTDPTAGFLDDRTFVKRFIHAGAVVEVTCRSTPDGLEAEGPGDLLERWRLRIVSHLEQEAPFAPTHPLVRRLHQQFQALQVVPMPWLFDVACGAVLQQRVTFGEACGQFGKIATRFGVEGRVFPDARTLSQVPTFELRALGIDEQRGRTLRALAKVESEHPFLSIDAEAREVLRRLAMVPGIGPWTIGMVQGFGLGDPDALLPGDVNLPHLVCGALAREPRGSDERMLELLAPFEGHRFRVVRLLYAGGLTAPPRRR
jgi:3-methyladenine DNA glycosylase/8-oxoguanine DNA glycosylase